MVHPGYLFTMLMLSLIHSEILSLLTGYHYRLKGKNKLVKAPVSLFLLIVELLFDKTQFYCSGNSAKNHLSGHQAYYWGWKKTLTDSFGQR